MGRRVSPGRPRNRNKPSEKPGLAKFKKRLKAFPGRPENLRASAKNGADDGIRTRDLRFTKPLLYQLSYVGAEKGGGNMPSARERATRMIRR
jgi:hypothetical protein